MDKDIRITITKDDLLEALQLVSKDENTENAMTAFEIERSIGRSHDYVRVRLRQLFADGRLEVVEVTRVNIVGRRYKTPAYRLLPE